MKRRILTLALSLVLAMGCAAVPASAADTQSEEMAKVTLAVKGQLGIGDEYDKFSGDCTDLGVMRCWRLSWSQENGGSLDVTADSSGKILSYYRYLPESGDVPVSSWSGGSFSPSFPAVNAKQVEAAAQAFLSKVTAVPESAALEPVRLSLTSDSRRVFVSGSVLLNGLPSPITFRMRLTLPDLTVVSYSREEMYTLAVTGDVPSAAPAVPAGDAKAKLDSVLTMELRYVDEDGAIALRYIPTTEGDWFVDAQTGELTDLSKLPGTAYPIFGAGGADNGMKDEAAMPEAPAPSLSPAEQATVDQMAGTLSAEKLDEQLKKIAPLGLKNMTQAGADYFIDRETEEITCRLTYTRPLEKKEIELYSPDDASSRTPVLRKYITVDAKTGALQRVYTSAEYANWKAWKGDSAALAKDFLASQYPERLASCVRKNEDTDEGNYVRQANGIPYYSNYLRASVCGVDGTIGSFSTSWDDEAQFPAPDNIVDEKAALAAYAGCFTAQLRYIPYPEQVDTSDPQWLTYSQHMGDTTYRWLLAYVMDGDAPRGVDAFTGEVLTWLNWSETPLAYTDLDGCYGKAQIEALAEYGVGFGPGDRFRPTEKVTQRDMLIFLLNSVGYTYDADNMDQETEDSIYSSAYSFGLLAKDQRDPDRTVTRLEFLKTVLVSSAYGNAAQLQGIYKTGFADADAIPAADLGYTAIGQALGIITGDQSGSLRPNDGLTRQDAAIILCRFMGR